MPRQTIWNQNPKLEKELIKLSEDGLNLPDDFNQKIMEMAS